MTTNFNATTTAAGTPARLVSLADRTMPTISMGGVTYPSGSAMLLGSQITIQADAANTTNKVYIGGPGMAAKGGLELVAGAFVQLGMAGNRVSLDDVYVDSDSNGAIVRVVMES